MSGGYEYGNTRLRAMRSRLLARPDYVDMMGAGSLDRMLAMLADTAYSSDVEEALVRGRGLDRLDRALRANLARSLVKMASFYEGRPREKVDLLAGRWDLRNLRALVRLSGAPLAAIDPSAILVPAGRLGEAELAELAAQGDVTTLVDLMVAWGIPSADSAFALLRARGDYTTEGDIWVLERAIDSAFAAEMDRSLAGEDDGAVLVLRAEIDARNLELALRIRAARRAGEPGWSEEPAADRYLRGGIVDRELWEEIAATESAEAVAELATRRSPVPGWDAALSVWAADDDLTGLGDRMQRAITSAAVGRFVRGDPLGFDIPVAFTFAKEAEIRNLQLIGRGLVHRLPMTDVEERLEIAA